MAPDGDSHQRGVQRHREFSARKTKWRAGTLVGHPAPGNTNHPRTPGGNLGAIPSRLFHSLADYNFHFDLFPFVWKLNGRIEFLDLDLRLHCRPDRWALLCDADEKFHGGVVVDLRVDTFPAPVCSGYFYQDLFRVFQFSRRFHWEREVCSYSCFGNNCALVAVAFASPIEKPLLCFRPLLTCRSSPTAIGCRAGSEILGSAPCLVQDVHAIKPLGSICRCIGNF